MKKIIAYITMFAAIAVFGQQQSQQKSETAIAEEESLGSTFTSLGNNWVGVGAGVAFQTDTGVLGYVNGQYNLLKIEEFNLDLKGSAEYADMTTQTFNFGVEVQPSYKICNFRGVDISALTNVGIGYGSLWYDDTAYSMVSYKLGTGLEFSFYGIYIQPTDSWVNYDAFGDYNTVSNHVFGIEIAWQVSDNWAVTANYSHWFAEDVQLNEDNEDRIMFGIRYLF